MSEPTAAPEVETKVVSFSVDANLASEVQKLNAEGWDLQAGVLPVITYHLTRKKRSEAPAPSVAALGDLVIDESKITVIPGRKDN